MNAIKSTALAELATASRANGADEWIDVFEVGGCLYFPVRVASALPNR